MSSIVSLEDPKSSSSGEYKVLTKGAPEVVRSFLKDVPNGYDRSYLKHVKTGARVLALAYKNLEKGS